MTGTVVDALLCLLLVSAAAVTVATVPETPASEARADETAATLAATTASVNYSLAPGARRADPALAEFSRTSGPEFERHSHGTLASLLADATVRGVRVGGEQLTHAADGFRAAVREETLTVLPPRTQVVVRWEPYPGSHLGRTVTVGPSPPDGVDVRAARHTVPSGFPPVDTVDERSPTGGYRGLARPVAAALVRGLFPPDQAELALAGDEPVSELMRYRYRRAAALYDVDVAEPLARDDAREANRRLVAGMTDRVAADLRREFDAPGAAADSLSLDEVTVVVRTWSA